MASSTPFSPALLAATPPPSPLRRTFNVPAKSVGSSTSSSIKFGATSTTRASFPGPTNNHDYGQAKNEYQVMKDEIRKVVPKGRAVGVLLLVFHDAGTFEINDNSGGMNGSIIFELGRAENIGLKGPLMKAKTEVDAAIQPDMIAVAGAEAVSLCGGPTILVALGWPEPDPEGKLPEETQNASALKQGFQRKRLSAQDLVGLSGAHTLASKGFGDLNVFDYSSFKILLEKPWKSGGMSIMVGLSSDRALALRMRDA